MIPHPDSTIFLVDIYHRETQAEAARMRLVREAYGDGPTAHAVAAMTCRQLGAMLVRAQHHLECIKRMPTLPQRGAFLR